MDPPYTYDVDLNNNDASDELNEPWRYGDEASLYSIAEDSRENEKSEVSSTRPGVELCYIDDNLPATMARAKTPREFDDALTKSSDDQIYYYRPEQASRRRRLVCGGLLVCLLLGAAIVCGVWFWSRPDSSSRTVSATSQSGTAPDTKFILAQNYVYNALSACPGDPSLFLSSNTLSGPIFDGLVQRVYDGAILDERTGAVLFDSSHGDAFLQEAFALQMLYLYTFGDSWMQNEGWNSDSDPCSWHGVDCAEPRNGGQCAVTALELGTFSCSFVVPVDVVLVHLCHRLIIIFFSLDFLFHRIQQLDGIAPSRTLLSPLRRTHGSGKQPNRR